MNESYLTALETALEKDLVTSYANIQSAFAVLDNLKENVAIVEADGALYTRYTTAVETLCKALEDFVSGAITDLSQSLDGEFPTLDSFLPVRSAYNQIVLDLLDEEREDYTKIVEAHEALTEKLQANLWYNFSQTGLSTVEQNDTGVYFEMTAKFPARINYNEKLNMATGITAEIEFTNIAYYNGDKTESGASKGANNISINFLSAPDSYKSMASGLNIIIWLFEQESSVDIVNARDQSVAHGVISTPINGGKLTISVRHGMYEDFAAGESYKAYIVTINGQEIERHGDFRRMLFLLRLVCGLYGGSQLLYAPERQRYEICQTNARARSGFFHFFLFFLRRRNVFFGKQQSGRLFVFGRRLQRLRQHHDGRHRGYRGCRHGGWFDFDGKKEKEGLIGPFACSGQ